MKKIISAGLVLTVVLFTSPARADGMLPKLNRGLRNTALGWMELPISVTKESGDRDLLWGLTAGLGIGIGRTVYRTVIGVYEIATFPFPIPAEYAPIVKPESVFDR